MQVKLPEDICVAISNFISRSRPGLDEEQAALLLLREALVQYGYLAAEPEHGTPPDELNAANDD